MPENWDVIYERESPVLYGYLLKKADPESAQDILQETFVKVMQAAERIEIQNIRSYLFKTARSLLIRQYKYKEKIELEEDQSNLLEQKSYQDNLEFKEMLDIIHEELADLKDQEKEVFQLRWEVGLSTTEISRVIDKSDRQVRRVLEKIARKLSNSLKSKGYDLSEDLNA